MATLRRRFLQYVLDAAGEVFQSPLASLSQQASDSAAAFILSHMSSETAVFSTEKSMREVFFSPHSVASYPGLLLDFGVLRGRSTIQIANSIPDGDPRQVHAFDAFEGLRDPWSKVDRGIGSMNLGGAVPKSILENHKIQVHVGWIEDTLEPFLTNNLGQVGLAHLDFDVYSPTSFALRKISPRLQSGSVLLFDDYIGFIGWENHSHQAFEEHMQINEWSLVGVSPKQAAFVKR